MDNNGDNQLWNSIKIQLIYIGRSNIKLTNNKLRLKIVFLVFTQAS